MDREDGFRPRLELLSHQTERINEISLGLGKAVTFEFCVIPCEHTHTRNQYWHIYYELFLFVVGLATEPNKPE